MKILSRVLFLLFVLIGVLIAVSNSQPVQLTLWPLPHVIVLPTAQVIGKPGPKSPGKAADRAAAFMRALAST